MDSSTVNTTIGTIDKLLGAVSGGWGTVAAAGSILILFIVLMVWLKIKERKARIERAKRETAENQIEDQASTVDENQTAEDNWDQATDEIDQIRQENQTVKKKRPRRG